MMIFSVSIPTGSLIMLYKQTERSWVIFYAAVSQRSPSYFLSVVLHDNLWQKKEKGKKIKTKNSHAFVDDKKNSLQKAKLNLNTVSLLIV